ncbi:DNA binding domain-containing protein, excisionase family [Collimonas sp. OK607]|uniref:helix-turn-helix domain-containing protein n=1 Tax=Collimonas sp. OK607 TaxID=1798194 RepID=UPI0008EE9806|nr:helix-turn-helix domain-containing protein [Collimonas sp. OK607]SFA75081.1 DNA binding domain-containing protein, excisionase family [Collimonas sp. OK607]
MQSTISAILKNQSDLLSREEAAAYLGISPRSLAVWKSVGRYNLPVIKVGRLAKYRKSDLDAWLESRTIGGKSE